MTLNKQDRETAIIIAICIFSLIASVLVFYFSLTIK